MNKPECPVAGCCGDGTRANPHDGDVHLAANKAAAEVRTAANYYCTGTCCPDGCAGPAAPGVSETHHADCFCVACESRDSRKTQADEIRVTSSTGGEKGSKEARFDLIPVGPLTQLARLYGRGAEKYAARNWERGYDWSLSYAAAQRHMTQFWAGEDLDEEMGLPHPVAAIFHMMALVQFLEQHPEFDDRPKS